jgi:biotin carboxyl carrier protein
MSKWKLRVNGKPFDVEVDETTAGSYNVKVDGEEYRVFVDEADWGMDITPVASAPMISGTVAAAASRVMAAGMPSARTGGALRPTKPALPPQKPAAMPKLPAASPPPPVAVSVKTVTSPMPGRIIRVLVEVGAEVKAGEGLVVLESMKMENTIPAPRGGRITSLYVKVGDSTNTGGPLADIE